MPTIRVSCCFRSGLSAIANAAISRNGLSASPRVGLTGIATVQWEQLVERDQQRMRTRDDRRIRQRVSELVPRRLQRQLSEAGGQDLVVDNTSQQLSDTAAV